ncbi:hypothetical protein MRB53_008598 [Persea americana]|uniref:Uncharacterized protein n=1 Tax=Persea americana TaxID=3435 RepID=A0ACC2MN77_PERAE|nr:hypothetical protein MRB53_008598 [Persea americana]
MMGSRSSSLVSSDPFSLCLGSSLIEIRDGGVVEGYNNGDDGGVETNSDGDDGWINGQVDNYLAGSWINLGPYQMMMDLVMSCAVGIYFDEDGGP